MEKLNLENSIDTMCSCGYPKETLTHKIFECQHTKLYSQNIRKMVKKYQNQIENPIDLLLYTNSTKDMVQMIQQILLFLKKLKKIKIHLSF